MSTEDFQKKLESAKKAESLGDFFSASFLYKDALEVARNLGDSMNITLCKNKIIEMNRQSGSAYKEFAVEQEIPTEEINRVVTNILNGSHSEVLKKIGTHPFLIPKMSDVEKSAQETIPITHQIASLSAVSGDGHLLRGGSDGSHSWLVKMYALNQGFISELYLSRIFDGLIKNGFDEDTLIKYFEKSGIFPKDNLIIISKGINRYFDRDYISAIHILIPQFENILLYVSERAGIDIVALNRDREVSTQLKTLSTYHLKSESFQNAWGRDLCEQLNFALFEPLGYMLRHKVAHGQIKELECSVINANLILYFYIVLCARVDIETRPRI
jgi:hypothetical protein